MCYRMSFTLLRFLSGNVPTTLCYIHAASYQPVTQRSLTPISKQEICVGCRMTVIIWFLLEAHTRSVTLHASHSACKGDITRSVWMTVRPRIVILIDCVMFNTDEWDWWISRIFEIRASIMLSGGETVSRNDGVVVVYQSCRQSSASSHGRRYRVARVSRSRYKWKEQ